MKHDILIGYTCPICGNKSQVPIVDNNAYQNMICLKCSYYDQDGEYYKVYSDPIQMIQVITTDINSSEPINYIPNKILFPSHNELFDINEHCDICNKCADCDKFVYDKVTLMTDCSLDYNQYCIKTSNCCQSTNYNKMKFLQENHFSYEEVWSLDNAIATYIIPRLKEFIKNVHGYPRNYGNDTFEEWKLKLRYMLMFFRLVQRDDDMFYYKLNSFAKMKYNIYKKGKYYFYKYFEHLWD